MRDTQEWSSGWDTKRKGRGILLVAFLMQSNAYIHKKMIIVDVLVVVE